MERIPFELPVLLRAPRHFATAGHWGGLEAARHAA
jgi:hypothetical protein